MPSELIRYCRYWKRVLYYHFWGIFYLTNYLVNLVNSCKVYLKEILDYVVRWMFKFSKIYRSYSDLYFGLTLFGIQCHMCNMLHAYFLILFIWIIWPNILVSVIYKATYHQCRCCQNWICNQASRSQHVKTKALVFWSPINGDHGIDRDFYFKICQNSLID